MDIGIGLPNTLRVAGPVVTAWARRAEERGFSSLATIDRIVYPTYDSLIALTAAAAATSRIGLFTNILLGPLYQPVWLAKATASLAAVSGNRFTLGIAAGGRRDDYAAVDRPFERRGRLLDETLDLLRRAWAGEPVAGGEFAVGPALDRPVPVLIGGNADAALRRIVEYGEGWTAGGGGPERVAPFLDRVRRAWRDGGRDGEPRVVCLVYFGLGDDAASRASLRTYYRFAGQRTDAIAESAVRSPQAAKATVAAFADIGVTELIFDPTVADVNEVDRLADAVL